MSGKEMRVCTHKRDSSDIGVISLDENLIQVSLIISEILLFMKCDRGLHLQS